MTTDSIDTQALAEEYLETLAKNGALTLVGGFDSCDPCLRSIVKDEATAERIATEFVKEYIESSDYEDEEKDDIEGSFGWGTWPLIDTTTRERECLAKDMVSDCRLGELEDMVRGEDDNATIPD